MTTRSSNTGFKLPEPEFKSRITDLIMELEFLRRIPVVQTTDNAIYSQLRNIFRDLDSIASARVEGNKTGLSKFLEAKEEDPDTKGPKTLEIDKISAASELLYTNRDETIFFMGYFTTLHSILREGITKESTRNAGLLRRDAAGESKKPKSSPAAHLIDPYMSKLLTLINKTYPSRYEVLRAVYVHQKYLWIHPFREANGITSRLLCQSMLLKARFSGEADGIFNTSLALCRDPEKYIELIRKADSGKEEDTLNWIEYALEGILEDFIRMNLLFDYNYLKDEIINPSLEHPLFERLLTDQDKLIMSIAVDKQVFQAADIRVYFPNKQPGEISKMLKWLKEKDLIIHTEDNSRKYTVNLLNKYLIKQIIAKLDKNGFLPFEK